MGLLEKSSFDFTMKFGPAGLESAKRHRNMKMRMKLFSYKMVDYLKKPCFTGALLPGDKDLYLTPAKRCSIA